MAVKIGNAVHDEHGKARGGQPGDQTGKEVQIQDWYPNKKDWRVFRPKSSTDARKIAAAMRAACENDLIGYDQGNRNSFYAEAAKVGFDPALVTTPCETDCSAALRVCLAFAGIKLPNFNTASEPSQLLKSGRFDELTGAEYTDTSDRLREGDVICTASKGHTAVILTNGPKAEDLDPEPAPDPEPEPEPAPDPVPEKKKMIRVKGTVRCREGNGTNYKQIRPTVGPKTNPSCTLPYLGQAAEAPYWYQTEWQGRIGWISSKKHLTEIVEV